jgi:hypothetical protein
MTATATSEKPGLEVDPGLKDAASGPNIVSLRSAINPPADQRVPAFSINGEVYTILTRPKTNAGLKYIHLARTRGDAVAVDFMLETLLGRDGYQALMDFDDLTEDNLKDVMEAASRIMLGTVEGPKGRQPKGSRRSAG